jgi:hypothetical protein
MESGYRCAALFLGMTGRLMVTNGTVGEAIIKIPRKLGMTIGFRAASSDFDTGRGTLKPDGNRMFVFTHFATAMRTPPGSGELARSHPR